MTKNNLIFIFAIFIVFFSCNPLRNVPSQETNNPQETYDPNDSIWIYHSETPQCEPHFFGNLDGAVQSLKNDNIEVLQSRLAGPGAMCYGCGCSSPDYSVLIRKKDYKKAHSNGWYIRKIK